MDIDELNLFLTKPSNYIKGTAMNFAGLRKISDRANLIAYLEDSTKINDLTVISNLRITFKNYNFIKLKSKVIKLSFKTILTLIGFYYEKN